MTHTQFRFIYCILILAISAFVFSVPLDAWAQDTAVTPVQSDIPVAEDKAQVDDNAADEKTENLAIVDAFQTGFSAFVGAVSSVLFYEVAGFPAVVLWLVIGGLFFTLRLGFVNVRYFGHGWKVAFGKYSRDDDPGEVSPFASLSAAVSGTVGLGNIAGVAVAVALGGPGAVIWMMICGFLGMSTKFAEVTMGHKYRKIDENGKISGGAFYYLSEGLAELNRPKLGKVLAFCFACLCLGGAFGGGNMFQSNQMVAAMTTNFDIFTGMDWILALVMAVAVGIVLIGGVKRIAQVAEAIVPTMAVVYLLAGATVLYVNADLLGEAVTTMFSLAFSPEAAGGGVIGAIINGFKRAAFSNEAGVGSAPIVMSATKSREPVQIGCVAILEPFIDTIVICFMTGLLITVTGVWQETNHNGVILTSHAFGTVIDWFPKVLSVCVALFAFSTMITWSYYGERAWNYLFGHHKIGIYHVLFCTAVFFGGAMQDPENEGFRLIIDFSDLLLLSMAIPNLIGLYFLSNMVSDELKKYSARLKNGEIQESKKV